MTICIYVYCSYYTSDIHDICIYAYMLIYVYINMVFIILNGLGYDLLDPSNTLMSCERACFGVMPNLIDQQPDLM